MASGSHSGFDSIIIVGAGPSGLLLALLLSELEPRPSITILDAAETLNWAPRATHHASPAIKLFRKLGLLEEIRRDGYMPDTICWRKLNGERLAGFDRTLIHDGGLDGDGMTVYAVGPLCGLLERELKSRTGITVTWGARVTEIESGLQAGDKNAVVKVEEKGQSKTYTADYVVGTDGGNSTIRRLMFGKRNFPGFTWEEQIVATNTEIDFDQFGWEDTQFVIDPVHWYMAARIGPHPDPKKNLWRISYGELPGLSDQELLDRQEMKFEQMLPGHPKPGDYNVIAKSPYKVHQRCCESMRKNRVMLAADAAHLCNPFGGMGLTGGVADIDGLFQCLKGLHAGVTDDSILSIWDERQRKNYHEIINPISSGNIKRLFAQDPEKAMEEDEFLIKVKKAETDPELAKTMMHGGNALLHDYSQYFRTANGEQQPSS